jgi:hypothetical protein
MRGERGIQHWPLIASAVVTLACLNFDKAVAADVPRYSAETGSGQIQDGPDGPTERLAVSPLLASKLLMLPVDGAARIDSWPVAPGVRRTVLVTRHDVYDPAARIVIAEGDRLIDAPRSPLVFLWGSVDGEGGSVLLSVDPRALTLEGRSETELGSYRLEPADSGLHALTPSSPSNDSSCATSCDGGPGALGSVASPASTASPALITPSIVTLHTASVAVDTDNELLSVKFGNNTQAAVDYLAQLFAGMNVMYERDLLIRLLQGFTVLRVSTTPDPYVQPPNPCVPLPEGCRPSVSQVDEFSAYWNAHYPDVKRALAIMISGKQADASTSGVAYLSQPCQSGLNGSYSFTQVYVAPGRPAADDVREVGHEIGHNFGTRHTHCYVPTPADLCWSGEGSNCYSGPTSCPAPATYSGIANVKGTVMSWCDRRVPFDCPVTNVFHPATIAIIQPVIDAAVGVCIFPYSASTPGPAVVSISPNQGRTVGGASVTVTGTGFQAGATVAFTDLVGSTPLTSVNFVNSTTITATTPAHTLGAVAVVVTNPNEQSASLAGGFTYRLDPTVSSISPNGGSGAGGTPVTITGSGFSSPATVSLGGSPATGVVVANSGTLTAVTGAHAGGIVDVVVGLSGALTGTLSNGFFYTPVILPGAFYSLAPCRLVDTRDPAGPLGGPALPAASVRTFQFNGKCGLPASAKAVSVNLTVVQPANPGYLTIYPADGLAPLASNVNFASGQIRANNAVFLLATDGSSRLAVFNGSGGTTHFILDVNGYFR